MHAWEQIQKTLDYIEEHLDEKMEVSELAGQACLSPFYYQRLFSRLVKKPVAEYTKLRRMARAVDDLLNKDKHILDIALDLGFSSHQHFSRTFKQTFGLTPDEYRKNPIILNRMTKPELLLHYTLIDEDVPLIANGIVLEVSRREITESISFVGVKKELPIQHLTGLGTESGMDPLAILWDDFHTKKLEVLGISEEAEEIGVTYPGEDEGYFSYFSGARSNQEQILEGYMKWELPIGEYIVCSFEAEDFEALVMDALYKAEQYLYQIWLPKHRVQTDAFCAERYQSHSSKTNKMEVWLRVVK